MKKSDLKTGMMVKLKNGDLVHVLRNLSNSKDLLKNLKDGSTIELDMYLDSLEPIKHIIPEGYEIVKVYNPNPFQMLNEKEIDNMEVIYPRKAIKSIEKDEALSILKEHFGCDVEIIE